MQRSQLAGAITISGIELAHKIKKGQLVEAGGNESTGALAGGIGGVGSATKKQTLTSLIPFAPQPIEESKCRRLNRDEEPEKLLFIPQIRYGQGT